MLSLKKYQKPSHDVKAFFVAKKSVHLRLSNNCDRVTNTHKPGGLREKNQRTSVLILQIRVPLVFPENPCPIHSLFQVMFLCRALTEIGSADTAFGIGLCQLFFKPT
jgi:hypothetical protein